MGYILTPTQAENDNKLINNTLESLKTTNLLKQSQDTTINPNLSTQNTQTTQSLQLPPKLPQGKIPQNIADSTKNTQNPQHSNTQKNIGFDSNVLSTQNTAKPLPQNDISTNSTQKPFNTQIALSSDKDFKPQSEMPQQTQIPQIQTPPKKSRLQREIESTKYATNFNQSAYTRNTTAFLGKPHEFSNHKLAMAAKLRLLENFDNNANISDEVFQRYNIIDNAVAALETAKKIHGENSKAYKDILDQYMQYGILKDNGIKDYASLAEFYNKGGNVGIKTEFKASENKESGLDSVDVDNTKKDETDKKKRNIAEFMTDLKGFHTKDQEKEQKDKGFIDKSTDWLSNTYKFDNKDNLQKQIDNGFSASEGFNILLNGDLDKRKEEYIKKHKLDEKTTLFGEKLDSDSYFANVINPANKYYEGTADFLTFGATSLLEKSEQDLRDFFDYMDMATSVSEGANKSFNEFREKYYDSLMEDNPTKKTQLKEQAYNKLKEAKEKYEKSPAKIYADSGLDRIAETIKHESDYGRIYTFLQDENIQKEKKQQFLSDFANVLKTDERYKDLDSLAFTKDNTLIAIMNEKEGQKAYAINPTLMSSILYTLYAAKSEIIGGIAGGAYGAAKGAKYGKAAGGVGAGVGAVGGALYGSMIGTAIGALTDSQVNRIVTGYLNSDLGAKKAIESGVLDLAGNLALMGIAKGVSKGQEVFSNLNADSLKESVNNLKDKAMLLSNGNVNAVTNFLAKNALDNNEREAIKEAAQKEFLNGKSLADYKSDSSIPKLERLKNAWQYEKFINKESMAKGKDKLEALSKEFESFQTTSMESNRPIMSLMQDMFEGKATRHEREKFLRFVSQNEALQSALSGVLAKNPTLALNFGQFIDKRAAQVAKSIESEALTQRMFKDMDSSYAKGLKDRYGKVEYDIKRTLDNINFSSTGTKIADILMDLKESIPHVTNAGQTINAMLQKLEARAIKSFEYDMFEYIEPNLNIDDLLNIRKYYNDILRSKDFKNASFKHLQAINKEIDSAVENALQDIAQQSGINTAKLLKNYKDINKEYADYAKFKESDFYKDSVKTKKREKDLSEDSFNKAILKQAQREEGFNNKVFNRIANNTDTNLQAQAIKELIQRNIANGNGQFRAVKWQELIQDLEKIEHSITDEGLKNLVSNLKQAQRLYNGDNEFLQAIQRSVGSKPANVLISSANGLFGRTLLLFYNFVHKIMARFAGALSENLAHQSLEDQLGKALRYARDTKDFIHVSIDSISKNLPKEDKETSKVLKELEYWKAQFDKDDIASFYTIKDAQETQEAITAHKQELQERKEVIDNALSEARKDIETIQKEVIESLRGSEVSANKDSVMLSAKHETSNPYASRDISPTAQYDKGISEYDKEASQYDNTIKHDDEAIYKMEVEFDKLGMQEFQRKIESGEIQLDKPTQKTLENAYSQYNHLLQKRELLEKDLQSFKAFDDNNILKTNSTLIAQTQRVLNQIQDDISFTKEAIKDIESELSTSSKALMPLNTHAETKKEIHAFSNLLVPTQTQTKPSFATNLMKQDTQGLIPYNNTQANNALIPYNKPQDTKLLAYNETKLLEYKETLHALQKLDKSFKDFMSMPFSIIVDSKGNALPLTSQAIKNFIFHNLYKEFMSATKALNKPLAQLDFKPLSNEIKALPYKANANLKAHLRDINAKTNELLDSMQELKNTTQEIKLLPYNKPSENKANEVDRFGNVLDSKPLQELQSLRNNLSAILTPILNKDITNISSGITAQVSKTSIKKMGSDKAINKSIENGFSLQEHFKASADIENLYKKATKSTTTKDLKNGDPAIQMHTFISQVNDNANAKILVKESLDKDSRRIYTLELESLESARPLAQVPNGDLANHLSKSKQKSDTSLTPLENVRDIITQKTEKETTGASGEKSSNETLTQVKEYTNLIDDFLYQYDLKDDLWFLKYAKLQNAHNRDEVGAALKHLNEVRDNVSTTYDDYVAATEKVKNSLNRAALDIIDDFKATDEAFEAIEKIQTKLLDDYPQTNKNISINTKLEKDSMQIESKSTQESIKDNYIQEVETIAKDFNLTDKEAIQGLINLKDEIGKHVRLVESIHDRQNSKRLFDDLFKDYWLDFFLANQKAYKSIKDPIALKEKISDIIFPAIQKDNGITQNTKDTHAKPNTNTTSHTEKENNSTDNQHEATQRENGADTEWITTRTSDNPQENKDTETTLKRDNGISNEYSPSTKEMAQSGNEKTHEKRDIRDDSSHSSSDIEANVNTSRDTQGHNAGIRLDETDNKRYKHDGNDDRDNSRTRIHRNVSLKKKGKKDSNTNTESKVATQDIDTPNKDVSATPQHDKETPANTHEKETPKTTREIIKEAKASGKSVRETKELLQQHKDIESKRKETQKLITQEKEAKEKLHKEIGIFEKEKQNALEKLESIKTQINELEKKDLSSKQAQKQMDKLQTNLSFFANEIEKTRNLIKQRKDKLATTQEVYIPQNHTFSYDGREFNTREHFSILKQRSLNNQDDDFNGFDTLMREAIENALNINPIKEFGTNYAEHYHSGESAIQKLISEAQAHKESGAKGEYKGQVAGAFHRKELGDIDLVWGQVEGKGKEAKGYGLAKIIEKHLNAGDFKAFGEGEAGLINAMSEIIQNGKVITQNGVSTIWYKKDENIYKLGISKGFHKKGDNNWIITSYKAEREKDKTFGDALFTDKHPLPNSNNIIPQKPKQSPKELDNIESDSNPAGLLNPEELATLNKEFKLGEIQDLKGQKALYDANIESLSLLDDILKSGRVATDDEKRILSNFRGFGKASNELYQVIKEKGERLDSLNKLLESLSESVGAKIDADYLFRRAGDAYYTPTPIVESMVKLAKDLGLNNNHVILEPSSGSGRFLGQFHSNANVVGIELDPFTAKLSQTIYPYFKIDNAGFQNSKFAKDDFYDLVIGNPPYSNFTIRDDNFSASAHNYFMKRGIDKLRVGGISIQIVTKSFMDSSNDLVRKEIAKNAKFLGGVRLPNNAFKDASVTTDILVFKKVSAAEAKKLDNSWVETTELNGIPVSKYFVDNPQNVLGEMKVGKGQFGDIVHVINKEGIDFSNFDLMPYLNKKYDFDTLRLKDNNTHSLKDLESEVKTTQDITDSQMGAVRYDKEKDKFIKNDGGSDDELDLKEYLQSLEVTWKPETIEKRIAEYKELAPKISELQSTLKSLQKAELDSEASNETISALRQKLNSDYEAVVGKNGSFYTKDKKVTPRFKLFEMVDDTSFEIFALEKAPLVKNNKVVGAERADIFTKRVSYPYVRPQSADNLADAMHISLNETGYNDYQRIADLLGSDVDSVKKEFLDKKLEYLDHNGERLNKDIFLSGDVKTRLQSFHDEYGLPKFSDDETIAHYQKIAYEDLKNVIPDDIEVPHIEIPLGANWLDKNITDSFLSEIVGLDYLNTNYIHGAGWKVNFDGLKDRDFMIATGKDFKANTGVEYINGIDYIEDMLNNKTLVVQKTIKGDKDKTIIYRDPIATQSLESLKKQLKREFKQYILDNDSFSEIAQKQYNDTFNREVARKYDGSHLKLHGANSDIELRKHQKNAVFRFFQELSSLLAHDVGTGKSYTMIASAIEGKRLKVHNKPMIVLPNHVAPQIAAEARRLYPNANIKLIQAVSRKDKNRQLASLKNNSHDIIITTYTAFTNMNVAPSAFQDYVEKEIKFLRQIQKKLKEDGNASKRELNSIEKRIEKAVERATNYAKSVANDKQNVFFEDLGIDTLMFDEAHYLKNLPIFTAQRNVRGIGQADSQRAIDAFMKISQMRDLPNNRVLFATGTPITNFISDIFTMQRFLGSKDLEAKGIDVFDEWCKMFAGASSEFEMKATGEYKLTSRLRDFSNLPELKAMYYKFADLVTKEDMQKAILEEGGKIIEPKVKRIPVVLKRNQAQIDFMESVKKRAKDLQENPQAAMEKGGDNMLKIISDSNKASIDMRLIDSTHTRDENGKISAAANNILEVYNDFNTHKGTQLVFLDTSVPKKPIKPETLEKWQKELERIDSVIQNQSHNLSDNQLEKLRDKASDLESKIARGSDGFSAYNDLKDLLIEKGIKENEVAFVHDFEGIKKETLSQKINSGEIRVLIGSTSKMGAGSNFQERLAAIHHLDLDWTPANMEQREGRIIRQGNRLMELEPNFEARIYTYVTEQMSDSLMLQTLEQKTKIIKQIQDPNLKTRVIEDISEDNLHGRLKAMTSPNAEQELEAMNIVKSIDEVENAISTHDLILKNNHNKIENANKLESSMQKDINTLEAFKKQTQDNTTISFGKEKINFAKDNKAKTSKDNKTDTPKATKESKDKKKEKSPESLANEKLNAIIQDFAKSSDNIKVICEYRGLNILAKKGYGGMIDFYLGKDLNEALSISIRLDVRDAAYTDKNYMQRFHNGYNKLISDEYIKELQGQIQKAKDTREKAKKAYEKEIANKESVAELRNSLNEMLVRQAELHSFLGRASDSEIERLKAIYGDDFEDIVKGKFSKESENKALDNNTANNIAENDLEQTLEPNYAKV